MPVWILMRCMKAKQKTTKKMIANRSAPCEDGFIVKREAEKTNHPTAANYILTELRVLCCKRRWICSNVLVTEQLGCNYVWCFTQMVKERERETWWKFSNPLLKVAIIDISIIKMPELCVSNVLAETHSDGELSVCRVLEMVSPIMDPPTCQPESAVT